MDSLMTSIHKQHKADFLNDGHYIRLNTIIVSNITCSTQKKFSISFDWIVIKIATIQR